ncbi:MAG: helix-turn-helix domain-containing protein [Clostridia bacterium]|nr:helix-turn-helix domain-containing protein [Clostridia bacterium]
MKTWIPYDVSPFLRAMRRESGVIFQDMRFIDYDYVFTYISDGVLTYKIDGIEFTIDSGKGILIPPFTPHFTTIKCNTEMYVVHFDMYSMPERMELNLVGANMYSGTLDETVLSPRREKVINSAELYHFDFSERAHLKSILDTLENLFHVENSILQAKSELIKMLDLISKCRSNSESVAKRELGAWPLVMRASEYIENNYADVNFTNDALYEKMNTSKSYLTVVFKEVTGLTIHQYLQNVRISHSIENILSGMTLDEARKKAGFLSYHSFARTFKEIIGVTPSRYQFEILNNNSGRN